MIKRNQSSLGIDLSDTTMNFCRMTAADGIVAEGKEILAPAKVAALWREHGEVDVVVIEAGTPSTWVHELLTELGARVIVADPRKLQAVTSSVRKSDVRDAQMLARLGLADEELLSPTYVRTPELRRAMSLLKVRDQQVRARTATVMEARSMVKLAGGRLPKCDASALHLHEDEVPEVLRDVLAPLFETLRALERSIDRLDELVAEEGAKFPVVARLAKISGIGPITALAFVAVVGDPTRFARTRDIGAYLGLVPRRDQSGQADPIRRISKAGSGFLRRLLVQCAQSACKARGRDTAYRRWAHHRFELTGKAGKRKVVVAVARKLAVLMLSLWKSGQAWNPLHRVATVAVVDAPQPVVHDECAMPLAPIEGGDETAPSSATRTQPCTEGKSLTKSADGSTGHPGASTPSANAVQQGAARMGRASPGKQRPAQASPPRAKGTKRRASANRTRQLGRSGQAPAEGEPCQR
jgi:transposase